MTVLDLADGRQLHYRLDAFTDPWASADTVLMLHGLAESGRTWFAWVPALARRFRLVRPDLPGFGESSPVAEGGSWSVDAVTDDLAALLDHLQLERVHVIGQRAGGALALGFALRHPQRVSRMVLVGAPFALPQSRGKAGGPSWREVLAREGMAALNEKTMSDRFAGAPRAMRDWWLAEMNRTSPHSMTAAAAAMETLDLAPHLMKVQAPSLLITSDRNALVPLQDTVAAARAMPDARLLVLPADSYHLAATHAQACATAARSFLASEPYA